MYRRFVKRPADMIVAVLVLAVFIPVGLVTAVLVAATSGRPVIFRQHRTGLNGKDFMMFKFRTMHSSNKVLDASTENQMTQIGKVIRALSLDEIPQLINIIKGEMSFIGPRPWIPEYYKVMTANQRRRNQVLPGLTGLAQVKGRNSLTVHEKIDFDLHYVDNISPREDIKIVVLTVLAVLKKGSSQLEKSGIHYELQALREGQNA